MPPEGILLRAEDLDAVEDIDMGQQLPTTGCQVHADYMMHGHYWLLRHHFQGAEKVRFFTDNDTGFCPPAWARFPTASRPGQRTSS